MELRDYVAVLRKYWRSITAVTVLGVLAATAFNYLIRPTYTSTTALFFSVSGASSASDLAQGTTFTQKQVESYVQVATSPLVLQPAISKIPLATTPAALAQQIKVTVPTNTSVIEVAVVDHDPATAAAIADAIGSQLVTAVHDLSPDDGRGQKSVVATVITPATVPSSPTTPKVAQNLALGLLLGLFLGIGQAILRETLDTRIRTAADVAKVTDAPVIGRIGYDKAAAGRPGLAVDGADAGRAEAFRRLRTNLQYLDAGQGRRSFVITSSVADEGKTSTAVNIAGTLAAAGLRVLLIDADLRKPSIGRFLGLEDAVGLSTYNLTGGGPVQSWADIAADVYALCGRDRADVTPVSTATYAAGKQTAPRPEHSALALDRIEATGYAPAKVSEKLTAVSRRRSNALVEE